VLPQDVELLKQESDRKRPGAARVHKIAGQDQAVGFLQHGCLEHSPGGGVRRVDQQFSQVFRRVGEAVERLSEVKIGGVDETEQLVGHEHLLALGALQATRRRGAESLQPTK
jgi:hypothetical protein